MRDLKEKNRRRTRAHQRLRQRVNGTPERPRLAVYKSEKYTYAQVIDDLSGRTLAQANSSEEAIKSQLKGGAATREAARLVRETVAERAKSQGISKVVFDRGGYIYHGKIKKVADGARAKGLEF